MRDIGELPMTIGVYVIETVDIAGDTERACFPVAYDDSIEYGELGFNVSDYIEPELYQSVNCYFQWDKTV